MPPLSAEGGVPLVAEEAGAGAEEEKEEEEDEALSGSSAIGVRLSRFYHSRLSYFPLYFPVDLPSLNPGVVLRIWRRGRKTRRRRREKTRLCLRRPRFPPLQRDERMRRRQKREKDYQN